ncbi:hypothetical protein [Nonomuraea dietziae]|uniref:hypothetical protein n=1 Tax=Nonomuraea dietziae TaxID=65515 RepID=UPI003400A11E
MLTSTEQEIRRGAPARAGAPRTAPARTGARRPSAPAAERTATRPSAPRTRPAEATAAKPARVRRPMSRKQRAPFVLLVVGLLCGGLISLLLLNTVLNRDSFTQNTLREETAQLQRENEALRQANARKEQPGQLARDAELQGEKWDPTVSSIEVGQDR